MDKTKTAAIYARYSSSNQREESIDAQLRICRKYAEENGYSIIKEYTDSAISGRTDQRPAFQQMIQDSAKGGFETLLIYSHDRFSRNKYDTAAYKTRLKKNGVRIVAVTLPLDDSPESGLMESIMEGFAQYYSENLARSTKRGLEENALHCKSNGPLPYGYKSENGEIVLDPLPAKVVNLIYQLYSEGYGKTMICNTLNRNGYRTSRGGQFKVNALHTILSNERYKGVYIYGNNRIEGGMPAIVSEELFDKVQAQVKRNRRARKAMKDENEYLLNGKAFCGECGSPLVGESGRSSTGEVYRYYKCAARKQDPNACKLHTERKEELEDFVVDYICREVLTDNNIQRIAEREFALLEEDAADKTLLMALQAEYRQVSEKVENILEAIEQGIFTPKTKDRLLELENRQTELEDRIVREKLKKPEFTADHIAYWLTKFRQGDIQDFEFKRAVINALVNSVFVYDDDTDPNKKGRIIIALNLKNGPVKTLTRSDVQQMGRCISNTSGTLSRPVTIKILQQGYGLYILIIFHLFLYLAEQQRKDGNIVIDCISHFSDSLHTSHKSENISGTQRLRFFRLLEKLNYALLYAFFLHGKQQLQIPEIQYRCNQPERSNPLRFYSILYQTVRFISSLITCSYLEQLIEKAFLIMNSVFIIRIVPISGENIF